MVKLFKKWGINMTKKVAFIGTGGIFSKIILSELLKNGVTIDLVIINIKKGSKEVPLSIELCNNYKINYIITDNINSLKVSNLLEENNIDLACVCSLHQIIKPEIFNIPKDGMINLHPSYLPYSQGPNPLFWMIKNNEDNFGATIHYITEDIDKGKIILREQINLQYDMDGESIFYKIALLGSRLLIKILKSYNKLGVIIYETNISHDELKKGFYNRRPTIEDYKLNIEKEKPSKNFKFINRITKWGIPWFTMGGKPIFVLKAIEYNENMSYDFIIISKGDLVKIYNRYGILVLQTALMKE